MRYLVVFLNTFCSIIQAHQLNIMCIDYDSRNYHHIISNNRNLDITAVKLQILRVCSTDDRSHWLLLERNIYERISFYVFQKLGHDKNFNRTHCGIIGLGAKKKSRALFKSPSFLFSRSALAINAPSNNVCVHVSLWQRHRILMYICFALITIFMRSNCGYVYMSFRW